MQEDFSDQKKTDLQSQIRRFNAQISRETNATIVVQPERGLFSSQSDSFSATNLPKKQPFGQQTWLRLVKI